ncbi:MAG: hypothetical protein ACKPKO_04780, partial [Candidatus Fonsibacter sp.]
GLCCCLMGSPQLTTQHTLFSHVDLHHRGAQTVEAWTLPVDGAQEEKLSKQNSSDVGVIRVILLEVLIARFIAKAE